MVEAPDRLWIWFADREMAQPLHIRQWQSTPFGDGVEYVRAALSTAGAAEPVGTVDRTTLPAAEGMVLVPKEPTEAMSRAGVRAIQDWEEWDADGIVMDFRWLACWKAMLAAALSEGAR